MRRGTVGGAEVARGTCYKHGSMMAKREILTQREKHYSYDLRFKLRAVATGIITAAVQEFEVDINNKRPIRISTHLV